MKRLLPILGFVCALVFACVREKPAPESSDGDHPLSIRDARMFFDELKDDLRLGNRGNLPAGTRNEEGDSQDPLAGIQPDWSKAQYSILLGKEVVEVPFEGLHVAVIIHTDSTQISESSAPPPRANSAVKLIAGLDDYGGIYYQILYISATWTYLETHNVESLSVSDLDNGFSGIVKFYEIEGAFIGGIVVSNSEQVGTIRANEQDSSVFPAPQNAPTTRAFNENSDCYIILTQDWTCWNEANGPTTTGTGENGQIIGAVDIICRRNINIDYFCGNGISLGGVLDGLDPPTGGGGPGGTGNDGNNGNNGNDGNDGDDGNDDNDDNEKPDTTKVVTPKLAISISPSSVKLGGQFKVAVNVSPDSLAEYGAIMRSGETGSEKVVNFKSPQEFIALAPGNHELTVKMIYNNNEYSESATISVGFPSFSEASADAGVQQRINELWSLTLNNATPESCREYGMAVYADTRGGALTYTTGETVVGEAWAYTDDNQPSVNITIQDSPSSDIFRGGRWGVGTVHTHPPLWNSPRAGEREVGLSDTDQTQSESINIPYMVIDVEGWYDEDKGIFIHTNTDSQTTSRQTYMTTNEERAIR